MEWNQILYHKLPRYRPIYLFHLQEITSSHNPPPPPLAFIEVNSIFYDVLTV